jgi:hypothetical protein
MDEIAMKTTDGEPLKKFGYYHLLSGQVVSLIDWAFLDGSMKYLVSPFYEGDALSVSGAGGEHTEWNTPYEVEGEDILVTSIYKSEVPEVISKSHDDLLESITTLKTEYNSSCNKLSAINKDINRDKLIIENITGEIYFLLNEESNTVTRLMQSLKDVNKQYLILKEQSDDLQGIGKTDAEKRLEHLEEIEYKMQCLEAAGLDNWVGYDYALDEFNKVYGDDDE